MMPIYVDEILELIAKQGDLDASQISLSLHLPIEDVLASLRFLRTEGFLVARKDDWMKSGDYTGLQWPQDQLPHGLPRLFSM